jgi:transposase
MALRTRKQSIRQETLWIAQQELPASAAHPFHTRLNELLDAEKFDEFAEAAFKHFYAKKMGRPSLTQGLYFRALIVGYFEGIDSERGIAWRASDSLGIRHFLGIGLDERSPDHSTLWRNRRLIDVETHAQVFGFVLRMIAVRGLLKGKTIGVDAATLEANGAMRSIVRRDTGDNYQEFLTELAKESGIETPTGEQLFQLERKRNNRMSNED